MKGFQFIIWLVLPIALIGTTRRVAGDGSQPYTTIQSAINACSESDSVLVYPGRYLENVDLNNHTNITLASLYAINPVQAYMDNTIIDGNLNTCITASNGEDFTLNGFTLVNNEQNASECNYRGGGIELSTGCRLEALNCRIRNCIAYGSGAGISSSQSWVYLSNVQIYDNRTDGWGGGMCFSNSTLTLDSVHPCSVYNNFASVGMDIYIGNDDSQPEHVNINLTMGSMALTAIDDYFIQAHNVALNVSIQQAYLMQTDNDLYVSPDGNDDNSGLSQAAPLRTIAAAMQRIAGNAAQPHTIFLSSGTYSTAATGEILPVGFKSHIRIRGAGRDSTLIDATGSRGVFHTYNHEDMQMTGIGMLNLFNGSLGPVEFDQCSGIRLSELSITNSQGSYYCGISLSGCNDAYLNDIYVGDVESTREIEALSAVGCTGVVADGIVCANTRSVDPDGMNRYSGFKFINSDITLRNSILVNNWSTDAYLFYYETWGSEPVGSHLNMSNVLIVKNRLGNEIGGGIHCKTLLEPVQINNCTIAGNISYAGYSTHITGYADIRNTIFYNPNCFHDIYLDNAVYNNGNPYINTEVSLTNCLFRDSVILSDLPELVTLTDAILDSNPVFRGSMSGNLEITDPMYYYLHSTSPGINAGMADTTGMGLPDTDLNGDPRIEDGRIDMGCYEFGNVGGAESVLPVGTADQFTLTIYPNPVSLSRSGGYSCIEYSLPEKATEFPVIEVFNIKGERVTRITASGLAKGIHTEVWNGKDTQGKQVGSGVYLYRLTTADHKSLTRKCILLR